LKLTIVGISQRCLKSLLPKIQSLENGQEVIRNNLTTKISNLDQEIICYRRGMGWRILGLRDETAPKIRALNVKIKRSAETTTELRNEVKESKEMIQDLRMEAEESAEMIQDLRNEMKRLTETTEHLRNQVKESAEIIEHDRVISRKRKRTVRDTAYVKEALRKHQE
jgi:uncharacterized coiled-coil DUF342 family protein